MEWDVQPPPQDIPALMSSRDSRLIIGPTGPYWRIKTMVRRMTGLLIAA